ncbi:MAG: sulfotransferase domain-containing protein [Gammaproteobacteria bacterium]|nr:sulfotransferase domain-containing protein [Gammaproteobacteria bacterium]
MVVYIRSLAYSGTTWINLVLGSNPAAFALGVPDRIWSGGVTEAARLCSIHGAQCEFWPRYFEHWRGPGSAMSVLAETAGARVVLLNNINMNLLAEHIVDDEVDLRYMVVLRDGRANVTSALRHTPDLFLNRYNAMRTWLKPAWENLFNGLPRDDERMLVLKYEDMVCAPDATMARAGAFLGIEYSSDAFRYWEHEHHYIGGNTGTLGLLRDMRGMPRAKHAREGYYQELAKSARTQPEAPVLDESWRDYLSRDDLVAYDYLCGELHAAMGYERDHIGADELRDFRERNGLPDDSANAPETIVHSMPPEPGQPAAVPPAEIPHAQDRGLIARLKGLFGR